MQQRFAVTDGVAALQHIVVAQLLPARASSRIKAWIGAIGQYRALASSWRSTIRGFAPGQVGRLVQEHIPHLFVADSSDKAIRENDSRRANPHRKRGQDARRDQDPRRLANGEMMADAFDNLAERSLDERARGAAKSAYQQTTAYQPQEQEQTAAAPSQQCEGRDFPMSEGRFGRASGVLWLGARLCRPGRAMSPAALRLGLVTKSRGGFTRARPIDCLARANGPWDAVVISYWSPRRRPCLMTVRRRPTRSRPAAPAGSGSIPA